MRTCIKRVSIQGRGARAGVAAHAAAAEHSMGGNNSNTKKHAQLIVFHQPKHLLRTEYDTTAAGTANKKTFSILHLTPINAVIVEKTARGTKKKEANAHTHTHTWLVATSHCAKRVS